MIVDIRIKPPQRNTSADPEVEIPEEYLRYDALYGYKALANITLEDLLEEMGRFDVRDSILQAEHEWGDDAAWNDRVAELLEAHPDRFACGFASVDPRTGMAGVREIDRAYHDLRLRGAIFVPGFLDISPTDARCYPIYAKCVELGIPVGLHTGINFSSHGPITHGQPTLIDRVACDFPELIIICHHGGWPWPLEAIALAWKHRNVYVEYGAISPKYISAHGGWGDTPHLIDTVVREQILFGTDWPMLRYERATAELEQLGLRPASVDAYLRGNARRLLERIL